jgi:hypothetical protein
VPITIVGKATNDEERETHPELFLVSRLFVVVLNITKPVAGVTIKLRSAVVILGGKKPLVVLLTSSCADAAGVVVPIPTLCAMLAIVMAKKTNMANALFMIVCLLVYKNYTHFL